MAGSLSDFLKCHLPISGRMALFLFPGFCLQLAG